MRSMLRRLAGFALIVACALASEAAAADPPTLRQIWHDAARDRDVPVRVDYPSSDANGAVRLPVVILSHGLGGTREEVAWIGRQWADHGYLVVHVQHHGSDETVWKGHPPADHQKLLAAAITDEQSEARDRDVSFAIDELGRRDADPAWPLHGRVDLSRVAMAGHSYGAVTTQFICGELRRDGKAFADPRVKCGIAFSPFPPGGGVDRARAAFAAMRVPVFYWTGTEDRTPANISTVTPAQHRVPFDDTVGADAYLAVLTGADHNLYLRRPGAKPREAAWLDGIAKGTTAFLDKYLKGDAARAAYLDRGGFGGDLKPVGTFERKASTSTPGRARD